MENILLFGYRRGDTRFTTFNSWSKGGSLGLLCVKHPSEKLTTIPSHETEKSDGLALHPMDSCALVFVRRASSPAAREFLNHPVTLACLTGAIQPCQSCPKLSQDTLEVPNSQHNLWETSNPCQTSMLPTQISLRPPQHGLHQKLASERALLIGRYTWTCGNSHHQARPARDLYAAEPLNPLGPQTRTLQTPTPKRQTSRTHQA